MKRIIIILFMFILPSLAMAQGQVTRPGMAGKKATVVKPKRKNMANRKRATNRSKRRNKYSNNRSYDSYYADSVVYADIDSCYVDSVVYDTDIDTVAVDSAGWYDEVELTPEQRQRIIDNLVNNMVYVSGGTFTMGATSEQGGDADDNEKPAHRVTLSSYYIGKYEVTQAEWKAVMGDNPSFCCGDDLPVEQVSWYDCQDFIHKLNSLTGKNFRLPTEAEWEFAARGGNNSRGYRYSGGNNVGSVAWYCENSSTTNSVGTKSPNELGLYDMTCNVWEWCQDWYDSYPFLSQINPTGAEKGAFRVFRGGCWLDDEKTCRVSCRNFSAPEDGAINVGLRLAM